MPLLVPRLLLVAALAGVTTNAEWQDPYGERRPGPRDPGRPPGGDDGPGEPPPPPPFGPPVNPLFQAIDTDDDGELSPKEIAKATESIAKLDRNKDGIITEDEVRPPPPPRGRPQDARAMIDSVMRFDKDGDGKVTAKELPERMARMLEQGDANQDGSLQRSEVEALSRRPPPRRPGPPGDSPEEDHGRPVSQVARDLGVTPEQFRAAFRKVRPAGPGQQPTEAQRRANRKILSESLGVSPERLDEVMDKYRPGGRGDNGPPPPPR